MTQRMSDKNIRLIKVLVASPSDVAEERKMAEYVIKRWNARPHRPLMLEAVLWESHAAPEIGERVQGILNKQIVDECDFAIGIFWTRIGTGTGVAPGGAVEEVERMMAAGKLVMLYFSNVPYRRKDVDIKQIEALDQTPLRMFRIQHKLDVMRIDATSLGVVTLDSDHTSIALGIVCHRAIPAIRQLDSHTLLDIISLHISKDPH